MASLVNRIGKAGGGRANTAKGVDLGNPFVYRYLGQMATLGRYKALVDLRQSKVIMMLLTLLKLMLLAAFVLQDSIFVH